MGDFRVKSLNAATCFAFAWMRLPPALFQEEEKMLNLLNPL